MADEPTPSELARLIERNHRETSADIAELKAQSSRDTQTLQALQQQYLLVKVYEADQRTQTALHEAFSHRLESLEEKHEAHQRTNRLLFWTVAATVLGAVITVVLTVVLTKGGGH